jgi:sodium-dependent dicarboxylate transporter 2/3/5
MRPVIIFLGPVLCLATIVLPGPASMTLEAWRVLGVAGWMALWWLTAVIPLEATALLPIVVLPTLGVTPVDGVAPAYAQPIIFLFLGGFFLAAALERWGLHRRFALATVLVVGTDSRKVVLGFMVASFLASMWISNTATAIMMLPIAGAVLGSSDTRSQHGGFGIALMLGIAYGASIGGVATLIGTPPNAILAGAASTILGQDIDFASWMALGLPIAVPMLALCWLWLVRIFKVGGEVQGLAETVRKEHAQLGPLSRGEWYVLSVAAVTAAAWIFREPKAVGAFRLPGLTDLLPQLSDAGIAIAAALLLFVRFLRHDRHTVVLDWETAERVPWGILLLFGGGLALAGAFESSGLTTWIGGGIEGLRGVPFPVIALATAGLFVFLTELTSNTATAALGMPLMAGVAEGLGVAALPLMAAVALSASMAFMLPVATPPNAIVFGSGAVPPTAMARAGLGLNIIAVLVVTFAVSLWAL